MCCHWLDGTVTSMERKTTPQETSTGDREEAAFVVGVAVGAIVCGVVGKHLGRCLGRFGSADQFGPVVREIQRAQELAANCAFRRLFKLYAVFSREPSFPSGPVTDVANVRVTKYGSHLGLGLKVPDHLVSDLLSQCFVFVHAVILTTFEYALKVNLSLPTSGSL